MTIISGMPIHHSGEDNAAHIVGDVADSQVHTEEGCDEPGLARSVLPPGGTIRCTPLSAGTGKVCP